MEIEIGKAEGETVDHGGEEGVPAAGEGLLDEAAKENFVADGGEEDGWNGEKCEDDRGRQDAAQFVQAQIVPDADAPVVWRIAVERHAEGKAGEGTAGTGQRTEDQGRGGDALVAKANLAASIGGEQDERQSPDGRILQEKERLGRNGTEHCKEAGARHDGQYK